MMSEIIKFSKLWISRKQDKKLLLFVPCGLSASCRDVSMLSPQDKHWDWQILFWAMNASKAFWTSASSSLDDVDSLSSEHSNADL